MRLDRWCAVAAALMLSGCQNLQHNDVMIFGTDTKLAFDVSASAIEGGSPEVTLGYKRKEAVWMPLIVNGRSSTPISGIQQCDSEGRNCRPVAASTLQTAFDDCLAQPGETPDKCLAALEHELKYEGEVSDGKGMTGRDAYSVFASFGADFRGDNGGRAGLAQFFATGLAAQNLANRDTISKALKVDTPASETLEQANARADAAEQLAQEAIGAKAITSVIAQHQSDVEHIQSCMAAQPDQFKAAVDSAQPDSGDFTSFRQARDHAPSDVEGLLRRDLSLTSALAKIAGAVCP